MLNVNKLATSYSYANVVSNQTNNLIAVKEGFSSANSDT